MASRRQILILTTVLSGLASVVVFQVSWASVRTWEPTPSAGPDSLSEDSDSDELMEALTMGEEEPFDVVAQTGDEPAGEEEADVAALEYDADEEVSPDVAAQRGEEPTVAAEAFWSPRDTVRVTSRWWKRQDMKTVNSRPLEGYSPYSETMDLGFCMILCDSVAGCTEVAWHCSRRCFLKGGMRDRPRHVSEKCLHTYMKSIPTRTTYQDFRKVPVSEAFSPLDLQGDFVVATMRCRQPMLWLGGLVRRLEQVLAAKADIVVYEQCVQPATGLSSAAGVPVHRVAVPPIFSIGLTMVAHILVNLPAMEAGGRMRLAAYVDANLSEEQVRKVQGMRTWESWSFAEFADFLVASPNPLAGAPGVFVVNNSDAGGETLAITKHRLESIAPVMINWDQPEEFKAVGLSQCPQEVHWAVPLAESPRPVKSAVVTYISNSAFLTLVRILLYSLQKVGCRSDIVIAFLTTSRPLATSLLSEFPHVRLVEWARIHPPTGSRAQRRWEDNYAKLNLFNMTEYDVILYVDADIIALHNPDELLSHKVVSASPRPFLGGPDWGRWQRPPSPKLNGGVLLLRPSTKLYECIISQLYGSDIRKWASVEAEQGFLRYFFGDIAVQLPFWWNVQKTVNFTIHELWNESRIALLHYVGVKPERSWSRNQFLRDFRNPQLRERLRMTDQDDDETTAYFKAAKPWRQLFFEYTKLSSNLTLYVLYHDAATWRLVEEMFAFQIDRCGYDARLFEPLALAAPVAPNGLSVYQEVPEVRDPVQQLQYSEFAALVALARAKWHTKPWVGFTTYSEHTKKALWREGVNLDWCKAENVIRRGPEQRVIIFWYGIFGRNYWELLHMHHHGMRDIFLHIFSKMNVDPRRLVMPPNTFWPFGNYIIMPYTLLGEYVAFVESFIKAFKAEYPSGCPFTSMERGITKGWEDRCMGYITERLLHFWAVLNGVGFEYAVDYKEVRYEAGCRAHPVHCRSPDSRVQTMESVATGA